MAERAAVYLLAHQPRRLRLPAGPFRLDAAAADVERALFDDGMNERYFRRILAKSYRPTLETLSEWVRHDVPVNLSMSDSLRWQAGLWAPDWLLAWDALLRERPVEPVASDPDHGFLAYIDWPAFTRAMTQAALDLERRVGRRPRVADVTEMWHSAAVAVALRDAGYHATLVDGRRRLLADRPSGRVYQSEVAPSLALVVRDPVLSDDVGFRYSDKTWDRWPLTAERFAASVRDAPGEYVLLGWDFETFGEHHWASSGIFTFLRDLPRALRHAGVELVRIGELVDQRHGKPMPEILPTPADAVTWAGDGHPDFFLGNAPQRLLFRSMHDAYAGALRRGGEAVAVAHWLLQSDHLHVLQGYGRTGPEAEVSAYFTPEEWWVLGGHGIVREMAEAYRHFMRWVYADQPLRE